MAESAPTVVGPKEQISGSQSDIAQRLISAFFRGDIMLALGVVAVLVVLILPMPRWALDISLAFSISFSVLILMTALFIEKPLQFNAFPMVLN